MKQQFPTGREEKRQALLHAVASIQATFRLIATLALAILVAPLGAEAQQAAKVYRIGRLQAGPPIDPNPTLEAFRRGLHDLGYVEGQNLVIESHYAEGREERLPDLAAELVRLKVEVMVAGGTAATRACPA